MTERAFRGVWIPADIWLNKELSLQEKVMLVEIDSLSVDPKRGCYKSNSAFAEFFGLSSNRVSEIIRSLQKKGFINVNLKYQGKQIVERNIFLAAPFERPEIEEKQVVGKPNAPTRKTEGGTRNLEGGYSENREERNTSKSNTEENNKKTNKKDFSDTQLNVSFDEFWDAYDKKVGSKTKLIKKWEKLSDSDREKIIQHVPVYVAATPEKQFRKNPETYLNNQAWNDEIITTATPAAVQAFGLTGDQSAIEAFAGMAAAQPESGPGFTHFTEEEVYDHEC